MKEPLRADWLTAGIRCAIAAACVLTAVLTRTPAGAQCTGDCDGSNSIEITELVLGVNMALGSAAHLFGLRCRSWATWRSTSWSPRSATR
jgi:hypothetical protein